MHESVLAHVATSLPQKENLATSALAYILNRSEPCRRALQTQIETAVGPVARIVTVRTEHSIDDGKRPDVLLVGEAGNRVGFMEVKFWAGLTEAQPVAYLKQLASDQAGVFVVLAPGRRLAALRNEFSTRCSAATMSIALRNDNAMDCGTTRIALLAWNELLDRLTRAVVDDRPSAADVDQLRGLCEQMEAEGFFSLTREEIDDVATPRRYLMLAGLVDEIVDRLVALGIGSTRNLKATSLPRGPGRYVALPRAGFWIGLDHERWAQHGRGPIWARFNDGKWGHGEQVALALGTWLRASPPRAYRDDEEGAILLPFPLRPGANKEEVLADAVAFFREIDAAMLANGMDPRSSGAAPDVER